MNIQHLSALRRWSSSADLFAAWVQRGLVPKDSLPDGVIVLFDGMRTAVRSYFIRCNNASDCSLAGCDDDVCEQMQEHAEQRLIADLAELNVELINGIPTLRK